MCINTIICSCLCSWSFLLTCYLRVSYLQSLYSIVVHGYVVHSALASNNYYYSARSVYVKTGRGGVIVRSYDKSRDNAPPTLVAYAGLQKRGAYLRDNTVLVHLYICLFIPVQAYISQQL